MSGRLTRTSSLTLRAAARLLAVCTLLGASCVHIGPIPARELYRLALPEPASGDSSPVTATDGSPPPLSGTLAIAEYATPGIYGEPSIVYRLNATEYGSYPDREWAVPLGEQLGVLTERVLARLPITTERAVFDPPSRRAQTYIWRATVREFDEVDVGSEVHAAVHVDLRIVRAQDDSIVWSGSSRLERVTQSPQMPGIVQTLSVLADEVVTDLATRARRELSTRRP
jgi:uncharacterized lipoprotein YmbA